MTLTFDLNLIMTRASLAAVLGFLELLIPELGSGMGQTDGQTDRRGGMRNARAPLPHNNQIEHTSCYRLEKQT